MQILTTIEQVRELVAESRRRQLRVGLVPTMGALHDGHLSLIQLANEHADAVVVSIFVNPTQFGEDEDFGAYPRDLEADVAALETFEPDEPHALFAPEPDEIYAANPTASVAIGSLAQSLCGRSRPGHFDGVATIVCKLFNIVQPDVAIFGRKDFQQLQIIRRMVVDLNLPVEVVAGRTLREADGLAMSSRNRYVDDTHRRSARLISAALRTAVLESRHTRGLGVLTDPDVLRNSVLGTLNVDPAIDIEYVEVVDPDTLAPPDTRGEDASRDDEGVPQLLVAVAAHVGPARLIDNVVIGDEGDEEALLAAT